MATRSIVPRTNSEGSLGTTLKRWLTAFIDTLTLTNPLDVASGGTGVTSLTEGGLLVGGGSGDITALAVATNGQIPIGDGTTAPTLATITAGNGIDITNGAGSITVDVDLKANGGLVVEGVGNELAVDLGASAITGTLSVGDGGTGAATFALNGILYGNAASAIGVTAIGAEGQILRVGATPFVPAWTTATFPAITTVNQLLYSSSANVVAGLATGNSGVLITSGAGVPSIATDIPTAVTIGSAYIYRVGGTDIAVADGGTNKSSWTQYSIPYASTTTVLAEIAPAANSILVTDGSNIPSLATDIPTGVTIGSAYIYRTAGTDIPVTDGGTGVSTLTTAYGLLAAGTTATGTVQTLAAGALTEILVGGGASALPVWTTATGTGAPVRATNPTLAGATMSDAIETAYATVASHATTSAIWAAAGNVINFTGAETITDLPVAPQAGAQRTLICAGACIWTHAGNLTVQGATNRTCVAGDVVIVTAITTTTFRINFIAHTETGTGSTVRATNPALIGPALGTPSSGDLQNCTFASKANVANPSFTGNVLGTSAGGFMASQNPTNTAIFHLGGTTPVSLTDNQTFTITLGSFGAIIILSDTGLGNSAAFFATYSSATIVELGDPSTYFAPDDTDLNPGWAIYKAGASAVVTIKNYTNSTRGINVQVLGVIDSATAPV